MVAYIELFLEPLSKMPWMGWETSLREYRRQEKRTPAALASIEQGIDKTAVPDALSYYPMIFRFHLALLASAIAIGVGLLMLYQSPWRGIALAATILLAISIILVPDWWPSRLKDCIERNRATWLYVFERIQRSDPTTSAITRSDAAVVEISFSAGTQGLD